MLTFKVAPLLSSDAGGSTAPPPMRVSELFVAMSARPPSAGIRNWALRQTSLDDVFMVVAGAAMQGGAPCASAADHDASAPALPPAPQHQRTITIESSASHTGTSVPVSA